MKLGAWLWSAAIMPAAWCVCASTFAIDLPDGFATVDVRGPWNEAVGIAFAKDGTAVVWERSGRVHLDDGAQWNVVIDIHDEVGAWSDHGMLGLALDPGFLVNGHIYLLYVVDHHHLVHAGTPQYDPAADEYQRATIGRLTRYTLDPADGFRSIVKGSRTVLIGETAGTGIPILFHSHGVGTLHFGTDDTLFVSCGDGASFAQVDTGGNASFAPQGLAEGIIQPKENVGAFRAQLVDTMSGKILRIDPDTGDGVASNPYFDPAQPRAPRSRVWALGLRNPCRLTLRPGTGSANPALGQPGVLYVGDVGWNTWEEVNTCTRPAQNFGWPRFEGLTASSYDGLVVQNLDAPNPLAGPNCTQVYFAFIDLLAQDSQNPVVFVNPCDDSELVPDSIPTFVHRRPDIDWGRPDGPTRTGVFVDGEAAVINVGEPGAPVTGAQFGGRCSMGGAWYATGGYPAPYHNTYFHADFTRQWIKVVRFDAQHRPLAIEPFAENAGGVITLTAHPITGDLYVVAWNTIRRIYYAKCPGDIVTSATFAPPPDGQVNGADLAYLLGAWGSSISLADIVTSATFAPPPDGHVDGADLAVMLGAWGPCD